MKREARDTPKSVTLPIDAILPLRALGKSAKSSRNYRQIVASIAQIGIVEPPVVVRNPDKSATWLLLDGHLRIEALKDAGEQEVECLVSTDDEAFTYNRQVSRLAPIQEHKMIRKAIERGVPEEKIALALDLNMSSIRRKVRLLDGICEEAVARVLKVDRDWLIHGIGEVEGTPPFVDNPDDAFVAIAHATPRPAMGGGAVVTEDGDTPGRVYHFRQSWIRHKLKASPSQLRIMHVEGDSMAPTLLSGDAVLVDMTRRAPNPPGIFVLDDGMGLVAKRLEHIPNSDPPAVRVISDNKHYPEYERTADEIHIVGRIRWFAREI